MIVVDQLRADYLSRHGDLFQGGLQRLLAEGVVFLGARHRHAITVTAAGHATLATGVDPRRHGFALNRFPDPETGQITEIDRDPGVTPVGAAGAKPASPVRLRRDGLADWLRAHDSRSRIVALALKDRAVIASAGRGAALALWLDKTSGTFVSSSYYTAQLPGWVTGVDVPAAAAALLGDGWERLRPAPVYERVGPDAVPAESDGTHTAFPHATADLVALDGSAPAAVRSTAMGDRLVFELIDEALGGEALGGDTATDLLFIGASDLDYVGHRYGPDSHEVLDALLRLDVALGELLALLDARFGAKGFVVVLSSDHGVAPMPERSGRGHRLSPGVLAEIATRAAEEGTRAAGLPPAEVIWEDGPYLRFPTAVSETGREQVRQRIAAALRGHPDVVDAFTAGELRGPVPPSRPHAEAFARSFDPERSPDVLVLPAENVLVAPPGGSDHGSPWDHDTRVPVIFFGGGLAPGRHDRAIETVDVAPTLARLAGVPVPADLDGKDLPEVRPAPP
jgi:hypothetical protein